MTFTTDEIMDMVLSAFEQGEVRWSGERVMVKFGRTGRWVEPTPELLTQGFDKIKAMRRPGARRLLENRDGRTTQMAACLAAATGNRREFEALVSELE